MPEPQQTITHPSLHGAEGKVQHPRHLGVGAPPEVCEFYHLTLEVGQLAQQVSYLSVLKGSGDFIRHPVGGKIDPTRRHPFLAITSSLLASHSIRGSSAGDQHQPGEDRAPARIPVASLAPSFKVDLLGDLLGVLL